MLKKRIITAAILIPITLLVLFYLPSIPFLLVTALVGLVGLWEWAGLIGLKTVPYKLLYLVIGALVFYNLLFIPIPVIMTAAFVWWLVATLLVVLYARGYTGWNRGKIWRGLMGLCVLAPFWVALNCIRNGENGVYALLFLLVMIWGADTGAYFVGKRWGTMKLAPQVSPGKTLQGVAGALIVALLITFAFFWFYGLPLQSPLMGVGVVTLIVLFSIVGDLFESAIKRQAGVKDSSQLLPGHGGLLDRIDSLTAAAPIFALAWLMIDAYSR